MTTNCYICQAALGTVEHADDMGVNALRPGRPYCSKCSGCDRVEPDDRCDACYADALGHQTDGLFIRVMADSRWATALISAQTLYSSVLRKILADGCATTQAEDTHNVNNNNNTNNKETHTCS